MAEGSARGRAREQSLAIGDTLRMGLQPGAGGRGLDFAAPVPNSCTMPATEAVCWCRVEFPDIP